LIELLISKGGSINKQDNKGVTPFISALTVGNYKIANVLAKLDKLDTQLIDKLDQNILH
jgi:ankyrin repeat protein